MSDELFQRESPLNAWSLETFIFDGKYRNIAFEEVNDQVGLDFSNEEFAPDHL